MGEVVRDVLEPFTTSVPLRIRYNARQVVNGAEFRPSTISNKPRVEIGGDDLSTFYTLVMVDPDAPNPSNPSMREYLHWLVTDIPGTTNANFGREILCYEGPRPALGIHRMVFVLFQQLGRQTVFALPEVRQNFNTRSFMTENYLVPVAISYFNCQRETGSGGRRFVT